MDEEVDHEGSLLRLFRLGGGFVDGLSEVAFEDDFFEEFESEVPELTASASLSDFAAAPRLHGNCRGIRPDSAEQITTEVLHMGVCH